MSAENAFIRAILAAPNDAAVKLIYADWLEERGDSRWEFLRLLVALDQVTGPPPTEKARERLRELQDCFDPQWIALMLRGRTLPRKDRDEGTDSTRRERRRSRRETLEADIGLFLRQYARKTKNTPDPNDRHYSREVEEIVKRMRAEDLDRLIRGDET